MIAYLDRFIDTRQKRYACFSMITMILGSIFVIGYLHLSYELVTLSSYQDVFALLESGVMKHTYLSRVVGACLSMAQFDMIIFIQILLKSIRIWELFTIVLWWIFLSQRRTRKMKLALTGIFLCFMIITLICITLGFKATTLLEAVRMMKIIGVAGAVCGVIVVLLCAYQLIFIHIPAYYEALKYDALECLEE